MTTTTAEFTIRITSSSNEMYEETIELENTQYSINAELTALISDLAPGEKLVFSKATTGVVIAYVSREE